jgi:hypothetical protein
MLQYLLPKGETIEVPCTVDLLNTEEFLHAHVVLDGVFAEAGDTVIVHDAPTEVLPGQQRVERRMATLTRATPIDRMITKFTAYLELTELYEVGFSPGRAS